MNQWLPLAATVAAFLAWCVYRVPIDLEIIQQDILGRAKGALEGSGITVPEGSVVVNGRDITLIGKDGSPLVSEHAGFLVSKAWGVREVHLRITTPMKPASKPPSPEAVRLEQELVSIFAAQPIHFDPDQDVLTLPNRLLLDRVVPVLQAQPGVLVQIEGNVDDGNSPADLPSRRAKAVKLYLVGKGVIPERLLAETTRSGTAATELHAVPAAP